MVKFSLAFALVASLFLNVLLTVQLLSPQPRSSDSFTFFWNPKAQNITSGTLQLNVDFDWSGANLSMVVKINDDEFSPDSLDLVFDKNRNGDLYDDVPYSLFSNKREDLPALTYLFPELYSKLQRCGIVNNILHQPIDSPYHRCMFNATFGYVFKIGIPKSELNFTRPMLVHLCFLDSDTLWKSIDDDLLGYQHDPAKYLKMALVWVEFEV